MLLLLGDTAIWAIVCQRLDQGFQGAVAAAAQQGWSLSAGRTAWRGWPFAAELAVDSPTATSLLASGLTWRAEQARLHLGPLHPETLLIDIEGRQSVAADGLASIPFTWRHGAVQIDLADRTPPVVEFAALSATLPAGGLSVASGAVSLPGDGAVARLAGLSLPALPVEVEWLGLRARLAPPIGLGSSAASWRDAGGRLELSDVTFGAGTLDATGRIVLGLDGRLQPYGDGAIDAAGLPPFLDALAEAGGLTRAQAMAAKAVVGVLAAPSATGRTTLPITLHDGVLAIARFPLLRLPAMAWR